MSPCHGVVVLMEGGGSLGMAVLNVMAGFYTNSSHTLCVLHEELHMFYT